jgi:hypothetical protein
MFGAYEFSALLSICGQLILYFLVMARQNIPVMLVVTLYGSIFPPTNGSGTNSVLSLCFFYSMVLSCFQEKKYPHIG